MSKPFERILFAVADGSRGRRLRKRLPEDDPSTLLQGGAFVTTGPTYPQ